MKYTTIQARRRIVLVVIAALVALTAFAFPGQRARLELTTARVSVMLEAGPAGFRALISTGGAVVCSVGLDLLIDGSAR